jgi:WD40 repeat protein
MIDLARDQALKAHVIPLALGAPTSGLVWIGDTACFALGDGRILTIGSNGSVRGGYPVHQGAILCAATSPCGKAVISGDDVGDVRRTDPSGQSIVIGSFPGRWVEHLVTSPDSGIIAASVGKDVAVWTHQSDVQAHSFSLPSTVTGLALDAKGRRLAVARYGGVSLFYALSSQSQPLPLVWKGSHVSVTLSPRADYAVSGTQETGLHGWKLPGREDMAMSGYEGKTRSFSWNRKGTWLATSGDTNAIIWPFEGRNGPMGKRPQLLAPSTCVVTQVAFHPTHDILAVGYADGAVVLARLHEDMFLPLAAADQSSITLLRWDSAGHCLAWGSEDGHGGILDLRRAV